MARQKRLTRAEKIRQSQKDGIDSPLKSKFQEKQDSKKVKPWEKNFHVSGNRTIKNPSTPTVPVEMGKFTTLAYWFASDIKATGKNSFDMRSPDFDSLNKPAYLNAVKGNEG